MIACRVDMLRVCPRDIYSHTVKDMDRQIVASSNDRKETRSTTVRLGPAVLPGPIRNTILGIIHEFGYPYVAKPGMVAYLPGAMWPPTGTRWVRRSSTPGRCLLP